MNLDVEKNIAFIEHKNGTVYKVDNIERLEAVNEIKPEDFNICDHKEFVNNFNNPRCN